MGNSYVLIAKTWYVFLISVRMQKHETFWNRGSIQLTRSHLGDENPQVKPYKYKGRSKHIIFERYIWIWNADDDHIRRESDEA